MKSGRLHLMRVWINYYVTLVLLIINCSILDLYAAEPSIINSYPTYDALTQSPPKMENLSIMCNKQSSSGRYVTFVGDSDEKALLVVFTDKTVRDLSKVITLKVVFVRESGEKLYSPSARVGPDATLDWAYVFDRNGDGRVDYLAFFYAAIPIKPENFPADYPKVGEKLRSFDQFKLLLTQSRMVFTHYADDNFDGSTDAVVAPIIEPERYPWVEKFGVIRSSKFNVIVDDTWTFKKEIARKSGTVVLENNKYVVQNAPNNPLQTGEELFAFGTRIMKRINDHVEMCGLKKRPFVTQ